MDKLIERHRIALSRLLVAAVIGLIAVSGSHWDAHSPVMGDGLMAFGLVLVGLATVGRLWCNLYIVGYKNAQLLTVGPYSMSRNPLYFFSAIGGIGVGLATGTVAFAAAIAALFALTYPSVIRSEEARLQKLHGAAWDTYTQQVPRFFPKLSQLKEPADYLAHPLLFRRHLMDAVWFPWAAALMLTLSELREFNIIPTVFTLA